MNKDNTRELIQDELKWGVEGIKSKLESLEREIFCKDARKGYRDDYDCSGSPVDYVSLAYKVDLLCKHLGVEFKVTPSVGTTAEIVDTGKDKK